MNTSSSKLFNRQGYISLKEYVENINYMRKHGPWRLPLSIGDKIQLFLLSLVVRYSWFEESIYMKHINWYSPAYSIVINYLKKNAVLDDVYQEDSFFKDFSYVYATKNLSINNHALILPGYSSDRDIETAFSKSLGEIIERMISGMCDDNKHILNMSPNNIRHIHKIIYPPRYHRFLKVQQNAYRELQHLPDNPISWVRGVNLITKENTYIPRQMTSWLGYGSSRIFKEKLVDQNSNGCAGYFTKDGVTIRALLETVSRDGFFVYWLTMTAPNVIRQETLPKGMRDIIDEFASRGVTLYLLDVTSLSIPSVYVVAINHEAEIPKIILSGAASITYEDALDAALNEIVMIGRAFHADRKGVDIKTTPKPFVSDISKSTRSLYWQGKEKIERFKWFISGKKVSYDEIKTFDINKGDTKVISTSDSQKLQACLSVLEKYGEDYHPVVYYPKNKIQDALGFYIAQVYIPKAFPLYLKECYGTFDSDRLSDFALSKNLKNWKLNEEPHMFS